MNTECIYEYELIRIYELRIAGVFSFVIRIRR